ATPPRTTHGPGPDARSPTMPHRAIFLQATDDTIKVLFSAHLDPKAEPEYLRRTSYELVDAAGAPLRWRHDVALDPHNTAQVAVTLKAQKLDPAQTYTLTVKHTGDTFTGFTAGKFHHPDPRAATDPAAAAAWQQVADNLGTLGTRIGDAASSFGQGATAAV